MAGLDLNRHTYNDGRVYTDYGDVWLPSVSWVLEVREDPPGLKRYKRTTSDEEKRQTTFYTQNRGTLIHYYLLSQLVEEEFWSDDEASSEACLRGNKVHEETGLTGDLETWQRFQSDKEWALDTWDLIRAVNDIHPDTVLDVELFVKNYDVGYAGQFDLLYVDDGDVVLADLKTSKFVYDKHLLQLVAYEHAVDIAVDRLEVIRLNPDAQTWEVSRSDEWIEDRDDLWAEFCDLRETFDEQQIEDIKERIENERE